VAIDNLAFKSLDGDSFEELAARDLERDGFEPHYRREDFKAQLERDGEILGHEASWATRDGRTVAVRENARAVRDSAGAVLYYEGTVEDVTGRKRAEAALAAASSKLETVIRQSPLAVVTLEILLVGYLFNLHVEAVQQPAPVLDSDGKPVDLLAAVKRYHDSELEAEAAAARKQLHIGAEGLTDTTPRSQKPAKRTAAPEPVESADDEPMVAAAAQSTARTPSPRTSRPGSQGRRNKKR